MLEVQNIHQYYGGSHILRDVSLSAEQGQATVLLGRNGVGKTTLLKSLMGLVPIKSGSVSLAAQDITHAKPYERAAAGIGYVPQGREIFARLTVEDNLLMGLATKPGGTPIPPELFELFPVLKQMLHRRGGDLSGGQQQQLAIGRALMCDPTCLLLDEPSLGLAPLIVTQILQLVNQLAREKNLAVLLVEQNAVTALRVATTGIIMSLGTVVRVGTAEEIAADDELRDAYLGS